MTVDIDRLAAQVEAILEHVPQARLPEPEPVPDTVPDHFLEDS